MNESPIDQLLAGLDKLDVDAALASAASDVRLLTVDGRRAQGTAAVLELLDEYVAQLRSTSHRVTAQWHPDGVWIAEVEASYQLKDLTRIGPRPRVFVMREGPEGFVDLRVYGAHEQALTDRRSGEHEMLVAGRWIPPL